jgi:hypothetical protein
MFLSPFDSLLLDLYSFQLSTFRIKDNFGSVQKERADGKISSQ